jgi:alpha-tubulin suppressor-like RCC1 family protein
MFGQLGDGTTVGRDTPVFAQLLPGVVVTAISAGWYHSLALASNHTTLFAWGRDQSGQLGIGNFNDSHSPIEVSVAGFTMTGLAAGFADSYAVTSDGRVLAWGDNGFGELGDNLAETVNTTPGVVPLPGGATATAVTGGAFHVLARTSTGHVLAWGLNDHGQLGDHSRTEEDVPVAVPLPGGATVSALSAGQNHSLALTTRGTIFAWGRGTEGELGNGGFSDHDAPVRLQIATGFFATGIASGPSANHSLAFFRGG